jgi:hypothetical protein
VDRVRIDDCHLLGDVGLRGQGEHFRGERRVARSVGEHALDGADESPRELEPASRSGRIDAAQDDPQREALAGLPAVEGIGVVRGASSSSVYPYLTITGAEKSRASEGTGRPPPAGAMPSNSNLSSVRRNDRTRVFSASKSLPSGPTSPTASGM